LIKKKTFKTVLPSKIFENAACGKPILLGVEGEAKNLIESYGAGLCFEPQNAEDFLTKLLTLKNDKDLYLRCRDGAKKLAESHDRKHLAAAMLQVLVSVVKVDFTPQTYQTPVSKFKT
jgi:glycosyltransferase involved in cell wall biosynthesis